MSSAGPSTRLTMRGQRELSTTTKINKTMINEHLNILKGLVFPGRAPVNFEFREEVEERSEDADSGGDRPIDVYGEVVALNNIGLITFINKNTFLIQ